jgi:hypothetical protein
MNLQNCKNTFKNTEHELHLDISPLRGLCSFWMCLYNRGLRGNLDVSGHQESLLPLDVSVYTTVQGHELHPDVSTLHSSIVYATPERAFSTGSWAPPARIYFTSTGAWAAPGRVYTAEFCSASRRVYTLGPELHLNMSWQQNISWAWTRLLYRVLCCT